MGALIGEIVADSPTIISDCKASGLITSEVFGIGGLIDAAWGTRNGNGMVHVLGESEDPLIIQDCECYCDVEAPGGESIAGFAAVISGAKVSNCHSGGRVTASMGVAGFAVDIDESIVDRCKSTSPVEATEGWVGGFAVRILNSKVDKSFYKGDIKAGDLDGLSLAAGFAVIVTSEALAPFINGNGENGVEQAIEIEDCYALTDIEATGDHVAGFIGTVSGVEVGEPE